MDTETNSGPNKILTTKDVEIIAHIESCHAKELLAEKLEILPFQDVNGQQKALFASYIYDNIMFATEKGFPWQHVCLVVTFAHQYLQRIIGENYKLLDAIEYFRELTDIIAPLSDRHKKQYTDFVYDTVLCHYNLYKYVFLNLRDSGKSEVVETVEVCPAPLPLSEGQSFVIWEYNNKLKEIDEEEARALQEQQEMKNKLSALSTEHDVLDDLKNVPLPYNEIVLKDLVTDVLARFTAKKEMELKMKVDGMASDLNFKFQKMSIPRPVAMGPPVRYKSQSPPHIGKSGSRGSVRGKRNLGSAHSISGSAKKTGRQGSSKEQR